MSTSTYVSVMPDVEDRLEVRVLYWPDDVGQPHYELHVGRVTFYLTPGQLATVADALLDYRSHPERMVLEVTPGHRNPG